MFLPRFLNLHFIPIAQRAEYYTAIFLFLTSVTNYLLIHKSNIQIYQKANGMEVFIIKTSRRCLVLSVSRFISEISYGQQMVLIVQPFKTESKTQYKSWPISVNIWSNLFFPIQEVIWEQQLFLHISLSCTTLFPRTQQDFSAFSTIKLNASVYPITYFSR